MNNYIQTLIGVDSLDATLLIDQKQVLYVPIATAEKFGIVRIGEGLTISNGLVTLDSDIEPAIAGLQANKQDKVDESLETEDTSVVGAINSLNTRVGTNENDIDSLEGAVATKLESAPINSVPLININGKIDNRYFPAETIGFKYGGSFGTDGLILASAYAPELNGILIDSINKEDYIGFYFKVSADYTLETILYNTNDLVLSNGVEFLKIDNTDAVTSVNGKNGAVVLLGSDITATIDINDIETLKTITEHLQGLEDRKENTIIWDGTIATDFAGGTGTEADPYLISNGSELAYLAQVCNTGTNATLGKYYKLTNDIVLNKNSHLYSTWGETPPKNSWTTIGLADTSDHYFKGFFKGENFFIEGLYLNSTSAYKGLFAINSGIISNVFLIKSRIRGGGLTGGIVGQNNEGYTINSFNFARVVSTGNGVGGISGGNNNYSYIYNCYNFAEVNSTNNSVGGICGTNTTHSVVENCYNKGYIHAYGTHTGSLVGANGSTCSVNYSYYLDDTTPIGTQEGTTSNLSAFNLGDQILDTPITIDSVEYNDLTNALNAWVNYSQTNDTNYLTWVKQGGEVEDRLPILTTNDTWQDLAEIKSKLSGIEEGAEVNVIETVKVNNVALTPTEKTVSFTVPTQASDIDALPDTTKYGATVDLTYTALTGELEVTLKDQDGTTLNSKKVDLPLELIITSGTVETCTVIDTPVAGYVVGDKYLDLVLANGGHIYVLVSDLVDQITITETGTGNAVTDISINGSVITETKGKTFVETSRTVAGKELSDDITLASSDLTDSANLIKGATIYGGTISDNLNTITKSGLYTCYGTATGVPNTSYSWFVLHENSNAGTTSATQKAVAYNSSEVIVFIRVKIGSTWGDWVQLEMQSNKVTTISSSSTDKEYASAKCLYDIINGLVDKTTAQEISAIKTFTNGSFHFKNDNTTIRFYNSALSEKAGIFSDEYSQLYIYSNGGIIFRPQGYSDSHGMYLLGENIAPETDNYLNLGITARRFKNLFLSGTIGDGTNTFTLPSATGTLALTSEVDTKATKLEIPQWHVPYRDIVGTGEPNSSRLASMTSPLPQAILIRDAEGKATFVGGTSANQGIVKSQLDSAIQSAIYSSWGGEY